MVIEKDSIFSSMDQEGNLNIMYPATRKSAIVDLDIDEHVADKSNPHGVTKSQVGLGNVPNVSTNNQTPTYTVASANANLSSGEKISVAFGKIAKAISSLIDHLANTSNPHGVTKSQVGLGNVGNFKAVSTVASQGLSDNEKSNARSNIGASAEHSHPYANSNHTHNYLPLTGGTIESNNFAVFKIKRNATGGAVIALENSNGILGYVGMNENPDTGLKRWNAAANKVIKILDAENYNEYAAAKSHTHNYASNTHGHSNATTSAPGYMSSSDKTKLDKVNYVIGKDSTGYYIEEV